MTISKGVLIEKMTHEIGFIHMPTTILGSGLLDEKIHSTENYEKEKDRANALLLARYDIENISDRSRNLVASLIKNEIARWWTASRYTLQIDTMREEIMDAMKTEVEKTGSVVIKINNQNMFVESLTEYEFHSIQTTLQKKYPGMIAYFEQCDSGKIMNSPKY